MGMELPSELRTLFMVLTGSEWPTADEDRLWALAEVYGVTAEQLENELPQFVLRVKNKVRENFDATAADFFAESVDQFTGGERSYLQEGAATTRGLQEYVRNAATQVQYAKWMIIGQLIQLTIEIAWAIAMAPKTFGLSLLKIPIFKAITRTVIQRVLFRLISELLQQMIISQMFALTLDALIQRIQIDKGHRDGWDHDLTGDAAKGALLDGVFGTAASFGGAALAKKFDELLKNSAGPTITKNLDDTLGGAGPGGKGLAGDIGEIMGDEAKHLLSPFGKDARPGWSTPIAAQNFRDRMGDAFADRLGSRLGREEADRLGREYADAFARHWGGRDLPGKLDELLGKAGGLSPEMRSALSRGVPDAVRDGLASTGSAWKTMLSQYSSQAMANAAQGPLSEGTFNLLFSDEKTFSVTWLSAVSGAVSGTVQQGLSQGGIALVNKLSALSGGPGLPTPPQITGDGAATLAGDPAGGAGKAPDAAESDGASTLADEPAGGERTPDPASEDGGKGGGAAGASSREDGGDRNGSEGREDDPVPPPQQVPTSSEQKAPEQVREDGARNGPADDRKAPQDGGGQERHDAPARTPRDGGSHEGPPTERHGDRNGPQDGARSGPGSEGRPGRPSEETEDTGTRQDPPVQEPPARNRPEGGEQDARETSEEQKSSHTGGGQRQERPGPGQSDGWPPAGENAQTPPGTGRQDGEQPNTDREQGGEQRGAGQDREEGRQETVPAPPPAGAGDAPGGSAPSERSARDGEDAGEEGDRRTGNGTPVPASALPHQSGAQPQGGGQSATSRAGQTSGAGAPAGAPPPRPTGAENTSGQAAKGTQGPGGAPASPEKAGSGAKPEAPAAETPAETPAAKRPDPGDGPLPPAEPPERVRTEIAESREPNGSDRDREDAIELFGAVYDRDVRGRSDEDVRADLPPRLRDRFGDAVRRWDAEGLLGPALDRARQAGAEQRGAPAPPPRPRTESEAPPKKEDAPPQQKDAPREPRRRRAAAPPKPVQASTEGNPGEGSSGGGQSRHAARAAEESHEMRVLAPKRSEDAATDQDAAETREDPPDRETPEDPPDRETERTGPPPPPVDADTRSMLDALARGGTRDRGGFNGVRTPHDRPVGATVDAVKRALLDRGWRPTAVGADLLWRHAAEYGPDRSPGGPAAVRVPVVSRDGTRRGTVDVELSRVWRKNDTAGGRPTATYEDRAKTTGTASQQSRKQGNITAPITLVGEIMGKVALLDLKLKVLLAQRQRGTQYQTAAETKTKRAVDASGDAAEYSADTRIRLDLHEEAGGPSEAASPAPSADRAGGGERLPDRTVSDVVSVVLPGRPSAAGSADFPDTIGAENGPVLRRAPRFSRTLALTGENRNTTGDSATDAAGARHGLAPGERTRLEDLLGPDGFKETMARLDRGETVSLPYTQRESGPTGPREWLNIAEISGGPVHYRKVGPALEGSSFSDGDKSSASASTTANRSGKFEIEAEGGLMGTVDPAPGATARVGGSLKAGHQRTVKQGRSTEHGAERARSASVEGDSALYETTRRYRITTTEGESRTVEVTTLDLLSKEDVGELTGQGWVDPSGGAAHPASPGGLGSSLDRLADFGEAHPVGLRWDNGDLRKDVPAPAGGREDGPARERSGTRNRDGEQDRDGGVTPARDIARRIHERVHRARPDLVLPPGEMNGDRPGAWNRMWRKRDTRLLNTVRLYQRIERAAVEADALSGEGVSIDLRPSGFSNLFRLGPGPARQALSGLGLMSDRSSQDGANHFSVQVKADFEGGEYRGGRTSGKLSSSLTGSTSLGDATEHGRKIAGEAGFKAQYRHGRTPADMPWFVTEFGASDRAEMGWTGSVQDTGKGGFQAGAGSSGPVDRWTYTANLQVSLAGGESRPLYGGRDAGDPPPLLLVETPATREVPGEQKPLDAEGRERTAEELRADAERLETGLAALKRLQGREDAAREADGAAREAAETAREHRERAEERARRRHEAQDLADRARGRLREERRDLAEARREHTRAWRDLAAARNRVADAEARLEQERRKAEEAPEDARTAPDRDAPAEAAGPSADRRTDREDGAPREGGSGLQRARDGLRRAREELEQAQGGFRRARDGLRLAQDGFRQAKEEVAGAQERLDGARRRHEAAEADAREGERLAREAADGADRAARDLQTTRDEIRRAGFDGVGESEARLQTARARAEARDAEFRAERDRRIREEDAGDLVDLPHANRAAHGDGLLDAVRDVLGRATGYARALWSGEAVGGQLRTFTSPRTLAAESDGLHRGGMPFRQQYEDAITRRSDVDGMITAEDRGMSVSEVLPDGGLDLTVKTENDRTTGSGKTFSNKADAGVKFQGSPDRGSSVYNMIRGALGGSWTWSRSESRSESTTFTEEDQFKLPGSTAGVTRDVRFRFSANVRERLNMLVGLPVERTRPHPAEGDGVHGREETRYRVVDLAMKGLLRGTEGLADRLRGARRAPEGLSAPAPGTGRGLSLGGLDVDAAVNGIKRQVEQAGYRLTGQSEHDIRVALSPNDARGMRRPLLSEGLVVRVRLREKTLGGQRLSDGGWIRLRLDRGAPAAGAVESQMTSERTDTDSREKGSSSAEGNKFGLSAGLDGGARPLAAGPPDTEGGPARLPSDRVNTLGAKGPLPAPELGTEHTASSADSGTDNRSRSVKQPGVNTESRPRLLFTLTHEGGWNNPKEPIDGQVDDVGTLKEIVPVSAMETAAGDGGPDAPARPSPVPLNRSAEFQNGAQDVGSWWRKMVLTRDTAGQPQTPMPESIGPGAADALVVAAAMAKGWNPGAGAPSPAAARDFLNGRGGAGVRGGMLPAAAGEQRLRSLFSGSQGEDGAVLLNGKGDGPFAVPGLDARVFTSLRPGEGRIIDVDADASTEHYTQTSHKEERSGSHDGDMAQPVSGDGTAAFGTGTDPAQGGFGPSAVFASQTASGSAAPGGGASAGKQASSTVRTDHGAPADKKGRYLVRMPLDALVVADSPGHRYGPFGPVRHHARAVSTETYADVWLTKEEAEAHGLLGDGAEAAWDKVADAKKRAADAEKALFEAVDRHLGLDRDLRGGQDRDAAEHARTAQELMELDPGLDPAEWSPEVREAVAAIRRHLGAGPGARNGGWDRTPDRERDDRAAARAALDLLDREAAAERPPFGEDVRRALRDLVDRRSGLQQALTRQRGALDSLGAVLSTARDGRGGPAPEAAQVHRDLPAPEAWHAAREEAPVTRTGLNRDVSGVAVESLRPDGEGAEDPAGQVFNVAEHVFDVRRIPLPDPVPGGPAHVRELTVRIRFGAGPGVSEQDAADAERIYRERLEQEFNRRYRLPSSGDQLHIRVESAGPGEEAHTEVAWVRDNPGRPGRSDTGNWLLSDGPDVWLHETLHSIGLHDEYGGASGRGRAGGFMDSPHGRGDGSPPRFLARYLELIEAAADASSGYDAPARLADLPGPALRGIADVLAPGGSDRDREDAIELFGAVYDRDVRGRSDEDVRADLPPRLRDRLDGTALRWRSDGRFARALERARQAGMEGPLSGAATAPPASPADPPRAAAPNGRRPETGVREEGEEETAGGGQGPPAGPAAGPSGAAPAPWGEPPALAADFFSALNPGASTHSAR